MANSSPEIVKSTELKGNTKRSSVLYSQQIAPYFFVFPFIVSFFIFFAYPVFSAITMSFQSVLPGQVEYIGLENYRDLWNPTFMKALWNSTKYTLFTLLVLIPVPLVLAVFLNSKVMVAKNFFRSTLFIPALTSVVVAGTVFRLAFGELEGSLMNTFVMWLGFEKQRWLGQSGLAMFTLVILAAWRWIGVNLLYFMAGLQSIPRELYESADIDGASTWNKFSRITIPLLKPISIYVFTISIYGGYSMFTESYMLWSGNRSPNDIGLTIVGYLYRNGLEQNNLGLGSAVGIALLLITFVITIGQLKLFGMFRKEE
ncbi:carbohydrate ABC transporter permease [Paenibacillus abyssi]|uniref:L-arabinose transport system permease protein AraP n=1 Tax=Paenibacillus abyssi TaxID=1340531 RepID=A0A917G0A0_9BACL|nr:sugar ABC transporter permease [Paenibacillus abyssi]GGG16012.1 L-arabinose transport system permease protein AraP [Paenibacillus abyssi]